MQTAYSTFPQEVPKLPIHLTTYFGQRGDNIDAAMSLPVFGIHLDLIRGPEQLEGEIARTRPDLILSPGVVGGRNVLRASLPPLPDRVESIVGQLGAELPPSYSLLQVSYDREAGMGFNS